MLLLLLLLLGVFVCVNLAVLVLRRERVEREHRRAPTILPVLGAVACFVLIVQKAFEDAIVFPTRADCSRSASSSG